MSVTPGREIFDRVVARLKDHLLAGDGEFWWFLEHAYEGKLYEFSVYSSDMRGNEHMFSIFPEPLQVWAQTHVGLPREWSNDNDQPIPMDLADTSNRTMLNIIYDFIDEAHRVVLLGASADLSS